MDMTKPRSGPLSIEEIDKIRRNDKRAIMQLRSRVDTDDVNFLNITAMMDMMTILLVFMLISFTTQTSNVTQSDQLALAASATAKEVTESVSVTITKSAILFEGEPVVGVHGGAVDASDKESGDVNGMVIAPLKKALIDRANLDRRIAQLKGEPFEGAMTVVADKTTPFRLLSELMYTGGQAEYKKYRLIVLQKRQQ
jgi:biopolymer transport protein ExbD